MDGERNPKNTAPRWSHRDEADLLWYHGIGQAAFERSTFGGMLERAELFGTLGVQVWPSSQPVYDTSGFIVIDWERAISARPTAEMRPAAGYTPDDTVLQRYAHMSLMMMRVERVDRLSAAVICELFGDAGARWAATDDGRLGALYHLTARGRAMITAADAVKGALDLTAMARMESLCITSRTQPTPEKLAALQRCAVQAQQLELQARAVWHSAMQQVAA